MILILSQLLAELAQKCQVEGFQSISSACHSRDKLWLALFTVS